MSGRPISNRKSKRKLSPEEEHDILESMSANHHGGNILDKLRVDIKCKTINQKKLVKEIKNKEMVICSGLPGTGKTFLSCAVALDLIKNDGRYRKIIIVKSVTTLKDEEIGFLKGTMKEKMEPFMYSFMHNFEKVIGKYNVEMLRNAGMIEEMPIAYMRGINIDNSIVIIDEAQNISIDNIRTIMTRLGENSKMIFLGDENQIDMKRKDQSSLNFIIGKFSDFDEVGTVILNEDDVVRNPLIKKIEQIFREN
jgi:phosphate starvation-inducible protein PhoH and related proteins